MKSSDLQAGIALEMCVNPKDLQITVTQQSNTEKYGIFISRGPLDFYRTVLRSDYFADSVDEAVQAAKEILVVAIEVGTHILEGRTGEFTACINPATNECHKFKLLDPNIITWIVEELTEHKRAATFLMPELADS
jgi:hypothetical protein